MAPARSPAFALCRGFSVDFSSHGNDQQRIPSSSYTKSLYADLLSDSYGAPSIGDAASGIGLSDEKDCREIGTRPECNYDDVFGGPPKLAALSSFRTRASFWLNRSGTCEELINGVSVCHPGNTKVDLNISRPAADTKVSPRMCYSDTDRKIHTKCEGKGVCGVDDFPTSPPSAPVAARKAMNTYFREKTSPTLVRDSHAREAPLKKVLREGHGNYRPMKENVKASSNVRVKECNGSSHGKRIFPEKEDVSQGSKGKESLADGTLEGLRHAKMEGERASGNKVWVTVNDVKLATDLCKFPVPSRKPPQPGPKFGCTQTKPKDMTEVSPDPPPFSCLMEQSLSMSKLSKISSFESFKEILEMDNVKLRSIDEAAHKARRRKAKKVTDVERVQRNKEVKGVRQENERHAKDEADKEVLKSVDGDQSPKHVEVSRSRFHPDKAKRVERDGNARTARMSERWCERTVRTVQEKNIPLDLREVKEHSQGEAAVSERVTSPPYIDDLLGISSETAGEFEEILGETIRRRKARWERHCRTVKRMVKALEEKHERDLQIQKEQAERERAGEMLDSQIKRWAAGKEGSLRALLCSLQYVLWPECGWQPVSPSGLLTPGAVRQVYRKAALCLHPDKVQQRGASIPQKYVAEKVFDLLKEASSKGNL